MQNQKTTSTYMIKNRINGKVRFAKYKLSDDQVCEVIELIKNNISPKNNRSVRQNNY